MPPITRKRKRDSETAVLNDIMIDNMGSFKILPTEIIELVLCQLDAPSLSSLSCTCKKLRELTKSIWREICKRLSLDYNPTPLCVPSPSKITSQYSYDEALRRCTADEEKWRVHAVRNWLYSRWKCVVCYRTCSRRADPHRGILLCETCHPLFYRRKGNAKEHFGLTDRDLSMISNNSYGYLVTDLIFLARTKYGGKDGLDQRLREKRGQKVKRETERECNLIQREADVIEALRHHGSSFSEVGFVDSRFMPYVSIPTTNKRCSSQTADDAAKWLISMKERYEARYKALLDQILLQASKCKGCKNGFNQRIQSTCTHISETVADEKFAFITENFGNDIQIYAKSGLLNESSNGPTDCESWAASELFERAERKASLKKALDHEGEWPLIVQNGMKDPLQCYIANDYVYKGVVLLEYQSGRCRLKQAKEVARVILAAARGWDSRNKELTNCLMSKGCEVTSEFMKPDSLSLMEDYVDHMVIVRNNTMIACSAVEVANRIATLQGINTEQSEPSSPTTKRCARIYSECFVKEDADQLMRQREDCLKNRLARLPAGKENSLKQRLEMNAAKEFIKTGNTNSIFGFKITTVDSVSKVIQLKETLESQSEVVLPSKEDQLNQSRLN